MAPKLGGSGGNSQTKVCGLAPCGACPGGSCQLVSKIVRRDLVEVLKGIDLAARCRLVTGTRPPGSAFHVVNDKVSSHGGFPEPHLENLAFWADERAS